MYCTLFVKTSAVSSRTWSLQSFSSPSVFSHFCWHACSCFWVIIYHNLYHLFHRNTLLWTWIRICMDHHLSCWFIQYLLCTCICVHHYLLQVALAYIFLLCTNQDSMAVFHTADYACTRKAFMAKVSIHAHTSTHCQCGCPFRGKPEGRNKYVVGRKTLLSSHQMHDPSVQYSPFHTQTEFTF